MMSVCEVCGHEGVVRRLIYCIKCNDSAVHYYCLVKYSPCDANFNWKCEDCEPKTLDKVIPSRKSERITGKKDQAMDVRNNMKKRLCKKPLTMANDHSLPRKRAYPADPADLSGNMDEKAGLRNNLLDLKKKSLTEDAGALKEKLELAKQYALSNNHFLRKKWCSTEDPINPTDKMDKKIVIANGHVLHDKRSLTEATTDVKEKTAEQDALSNDYFPYNGSSSTGNHVNVKESVAGKSDLMKAPFLHKTSSSANHVGVNGKKSEKVALPIGHLIPKKKSSTADPVEGKMIQKNASKNQRLLPTNGPLTADPVYETEGKMVEKSALPSDHFIYTERFSSGDHVCHNEQNAKKSELLDHVLPPKKRVSTTEIIEVKEKMASEPVIRNDHTLPMKLSSPADEVNIKENLDEKSVLTNDDSLHSKSSSPADVCEMNEKMRESVALNNSCSLPPLYHPSCSYAAKPVADPIWRGAFIISNFKIQSLQLTAHLSSKACERVSEAARTIPFLVDVNFLPRCEAWPVRFQKSPPSDDNIALFLFPEFARDEKVYDTLLEEINKHDAALKTTINNVDLLIFSSLELPREHWRYQRKYYMWGVFRKSSM